VILPPFLIFGLPSLQKIVRHFPHIGEIGDEKAAQSLKLAWDQIHSHTERLDRAEKAIKLLGDGHNANEAAVTAAREAAEAALAIAQQPDTQGDVGGVATSPDELPGGGDGGAASAGFAAAPETGHDGGSALTATRAGQIAGGTAREFSGLTAAVADSPAREANQLELLLRMIWHLRQAGFSAGRQKNPSGRISGDKLCVVVDGVLRAYDMFQGVPPTEPMPCHMNEVGPPVMVDDPGTPD
jgi:hypothetical protein